MAETDLGEALKKYLKPERDGWGTVSQSFESAIRAVEGFVKPFSQVQNAAIELAKTIGLSSKSIMNTATRMVEQNRKMALSMSYNISSEDMIKMQTSLMSKLGRNIAIDQVGTIQRNANGEIVNPNFDSELENLVAASKVFGPDIVADIVAGFDKVGKSMNTAAKATGKIFQEAGEYGINLQLYAKNFTENLTMAQMYNFRNGVNGLKEMARRATEIRQDMKQIAQFADKVGSVTGAVETAANLQVLGGSFAALANPLTMLNKSLTDVEGLQGIMSGMTAGAARYNSVTHEIEMDPVTRQIMKRAAESMGVDPANLIDQAYAQARRAEITRQMNTSGIGNLLPEFAKMIPNVGEINEFGMAGVTVGNEFKTLAEISSMNAVEQENLQKQLIEENRSESEDIKVIAKSVMGIEDMVSGRVHQMANEQARNKILPGVVGGTSTYDEALNYVVNTFTDKVTRSIAAMDFPFESLKQKWDIAKIDAVTSFASPFEDFNNPEQFGREMTDAFTSVFGEGELSRTLGSLAGRISEKFADITGSINGFITNASSGNIDFFRGLKNEVLNVNVVGGIPLAAAASELSPEATTIVGADNISFGLSRVENGLNGLQEQARIIPTPTFGTAENSIPGAYVLANTSQNNGNQSTIQQETTTNGNYNLNLSGVLTMNINGDNGNIGTVDLMKMFEKDEGFKREITKIIMDAASRMSASGLNNNQN